MIIQCPKCKTKFVLKDKTQEQVLGKQVKCCKCETQWTLDASSFTGTPLPQISFDLEDTIMKKEDIKEEIDNSDAKQQNDFSEMLKNNLTTENNYKKIFFKKNKKILLYLGIFIFYVFISFFIAKNIFFNDNNNWPVAELSKTDILSGNNPKIKIYGKIINKSDNLYQIPKIIILFLNDKGKTVSRRFGEINQKIIGKYSVIDFSFTFDYKDDSIKKVKVYLDK